VIRAGVEPQLDLDVAVPDHHQDVVLAVAGRNRVIGPAWSRSSTSALLDTSRTWCWPLPAGTG